MMRYRAILALLLSLMILLSAPIALADGTEDAPELENTEWVEVRTVEDLMAMTEDPIGHYRLMNDLDLAGVEWTPLDFRGKFDGNGFAIINLTLTKPGEEMGISYDGNEKDYQTRFVGLFGILRNASVTNLKLLNVRACMDVDYPCFLGGIAGYCDNSSITAGSPYIRYRHPGASGLQGYLRRWRCGRLRHRPDCPVYRGYDIADRGYGYQHPGGAVPGRCLCHRFYRHRG